MLTARVSAQSLVFVGDVRACCWDIPLDLPYQPVAKVVQERKMGTATNSLPVMALDTKHLD